MAYISPLELTIRRISEELIEKQEGQVIEAIYQQGIKVDKEELIKALNYDRHQYEQGYEDAKKKYKAPDGQWIIIDGDKICPFCMMGTMGKANASVPFFHFCPYCGADLRKHKEEEPE